MGGALVLLLGFDQFGDAAETLLLGAVIEEEGADAGAKVGTKGFGRGGSVVGEAEGKALLAGGAAVVGGDGGDGNDGLVPGIIFLLNAGNIGRAAGVTEAAIHGDIGTKGGIGGKGAGNDAIGNKEGGKEADNVVVGKGEHLGGGIVGDDVDGDLGEALGGGGRDGQVHLDYKVLGIAIMDGNGAKGDGMA